MSSNRTDIHEEIYKTIADSYDKNKYYELFRKDRVLTDTEKRLLDKFWQDTLINGGHLVHMSGQSYFTGYVHVLSVGCGDANLFERYLFQKGNINISGIDISPEQVNRARSNLPFSNFMCGNFLDMNEHAHDQFDGIICMYALFNFVEQDQHDALLKMYNMLIKGGKCFINVRLEIAKGVKYSSSWCGEKMYWYLPGLITVLDWCYEIGFKYRVYKNPDNEDYVFVMLEKPEE